MYSITVDETTDMVELIVFMISGEISGHGINEDFIIQEDSIASKLMYVTTVKMFPGGKLAISELDSLITKKNISCITEMTCNLYNFNLLLKSNL